MFFKGEKYLQKLSQQLSPNYLQITTQNSLLN